MSIRLKNINIQKKMKFNLYENFQLLPKQFVQLQWPSSYYFFSLYFLFLLLFISYSLNLSLLFLVDLSTGAGTLL